jgi:hypothetical protein
MPALLLAVGEQHSLSGMNMLSVEARRFNSQFGDDLVSIISYSVGDVNVEIIAISVKDMYNMGWLGAYVFS